MTDYLYVKLCQRPLIRTALQGTIEGNVIYYKILRMLKFHPITALMKTYANF